MHRNPFIVAAAVGLGATLLPLASPAAAAPQTFVVTAPGESGPGSLRQAVADANANPGRDTITFAAGSAFATVGSTPVTITDPVVIDGCSAARPTLTDLVQITAGPNTAVVVDAPDVLVQGVHMAGGTHPFDVTAQGDRFTLRAAFLNATGDSLRVTGADDVVLGGVAPAPCPVLGGDASILVNGAAHGIELVTTTRATVDRVRSLSVPIGPTVLVRGGTGTTIKGSFITGGAGTGGYPDIPPGTGVVFDNAGTPAAPARFFGSEVTDCLGDCLVVMRSSTVEVGAPGSHTVLRRNFNPTNTPLYIEGSSAHVSHLYSEFGEFAGVLLGRGNHDVLIEDSDIGMARSGSGIVVGGAPASRDVVIRRNNIGFTDVDRAGNATPRQPWHSRDHGIVVYASDGLRIEGNVLGSDPLGEVLAIGPAVAGLQIVGNSMGFDPATGDIPVDGNHISWPTTYGVRLSGVLGAVVQGNAVGRVGSDAISIADGSNGTRVVGNRVGTTPTGLPAPNYFDGIQVMSSDDVEISGNAVSGSGTDGITATGARVVIADNLVGPNGMWGINADSPGGRITANTVTGNPQAIGVGDGMTATDNRLDANASGFTLHGDGSVLRRNVVTGTTGANAAVVVKGQRNTITEAAMFANAGNAIDLVGAANGGILPPVPAAAAAVTPGSETMRVTGTTPGTSSGTVDVYGNTTCGPTDHEAELWLGRFTFSGGSFSGVVLRPVMGMTQLTLTVTDGDGDTSELSSCLAYTGTPRKALPPRPTPPPPTFPPLFP